MKRIFKTKGFDRWASKAGCSDDALRTVVREMEQGLVGVSLGGNTYKKRVPLPGRGKSGGARSIIASNLGDRWFFEYGFGKNEKENIEPERLKVLKAYSRWALGRSPADLDGLVECGDLVEVAYVTEK